MDSDLSVLVYSSNKNVRSDVINALGARPSTDLPPVKYTEAATEPALITLVDHDKYDLIILDGEAAPAGGMGIARPQDAWLATWSRADAVVALPIEPVATAKAVTKLLSTRIALSS